MMLDVTLCGLKRETLQEKSTPFTQGESGAPSTNRAPLVPDLPTEEK